VTAQDQRDEAPGGVCIWLTGRSGSGKSTITHALIPMLERADRVMTILDVVPVLEKQPCERTSEGKLLRKAFVASEVVRHGGIAICVTVSARRSTRAEAREMVGADRFLEIHVDPPADLARARKEARGRRPSLSKRAKLLRRRLVAIVRGPKSVSHEAPSGADLRIDTALTPAEEGALAIYRLLVERGFVTDTAVVPQP
jgi:sulfate adenylyltransferase